MEWMVMPLRRYADFKGRSRRKEYWMFLLAMMIAFAIIFVISDILSPGRGTDPLSQPLVLIGLLAILLPSLAVQVRRFHDQDKSGWFVLLGLIPFVGGLIVLIFMCLEGTRGENSYGPDPKAENYGDVFN